MREVRRIYRPKWMPGRWWQRRCRKLAEAADGTPFAVLADDDVACILAPEYRSLAADA